MEDYVAPPGQVELEYWNTAFDSSVPSQRFQVFNQEADRLGVVGGLVLDEQVLVAHVVLAGVTVARAG
jgi:hypothetical protein